MLRRRARDGHALAPRLTRLEGAPLSLSATKNDGAGPLAAASAATQDLDAPPWLRSLETTLIATARQVRQVYDRRFEPEGLNLPQACTLAFLAEAGSETQTRLALRLGMGRAAVGSVIDGLEARGLVERQPDPTDRRVWRVALTRDGGAQVAPIRAIDEKVRSELRSGLSRAERQQLAQLLLRLQDNLGRALAVSPEAGEDDAHD